MGDNVITFYYVPNGAKVTVSYVDMEVDLNFPSLEYDLMARGVDIIRSMHDFNGIPKDLPELAKVVASCGEIPKIAVTLSSQAELDEFRIRKVIESE